MLQVHLVANTQTQIPTDPPPMTYSSRPALTHLLTNDAFGRTFVRACVRASARKCLRGVFALLF